MSPYRDNPSFVFFYQEMDNISLFSITNSPTVQNEREADEHNDTSKGQQTNKGKPEKETKEAEGLSTFTTPLLSSASPSSNITTPIKDYGANTSTSSADVHKSDVANCSITGRF